MIKVAESAPITKIPIIFAAFANFSVASLILTRGGEKSGPDKILDRLSARFRRARGGEKKLPLTIGGKMWYTINRKCRSGGKTGY